MKAQSNRNEPALSAGKAVLLGHLLVNMPAALIMLGFGVVGVLFFRGGWWLVLFLGFILAWTWWSFTVPRWRRWALERGAPPDKLQRLAAQTGLVWPKGWVFEKTEFKVDKKNDQK